MSSGSAFRWIDDDDDGIEEVRICRLCVSASYDDVCRQCGRVMLPVFTTPQKGVAYTAEWLTNVLRDGPLLADELRERASMEFPVEWWRITEIADKLGFGFGTFFALPYDHPYGRAARDSQ